MASLSLQHITKRYPNGFEAVKDFNLEIADKEFIIFVGPSGCGKSTTLRMIAGLEEISDGTLKIDDKVVNDVEPKDRDIAMVFQNYALYPHMTVYDNMAFGLKLRKVPKDQIDKQVKEAAKILDLEKLLDRKPKALSGGQRQRVAMGRAIVRDPKVFLMDEPLSNLDAKVKVNGNDVTLTVGKYNMKLPASKAKAVIDGGYDGKTVVMGIRPENVHDSQMFIETSKDSVVECKINVYELLGAEVYLYFDCEGFPMTARVDPRTTARSGDTVKFALDMEKVHLFDKETEITITN